MSATATRLEELIEEMLNKAATHAFETEDREAYLCGAEFGARYVLQRLVDEAIAVFVTLESDE